MPNNLAHQLEDQLYIHVNPETSLHDVTEILVREEVCAVPVLDHNNPPVVVGIVTNRDVAFCAWVAGKTLRELTAGQAMQVKLFELYDDDSSMPELNRLYGDIVNRYLNPPPPADPSPQPPGI